MLFFVLFQSVPVILLLTLAGALYLTWYDVKDEPGVEFQVKMWWFLLVLLFHVPGYLVFRAWLGVRRRRREQDGDAHTSTPGPRGRRGGGRA